jgi:predicted nuclease of predicted toxin-antitoxin system
MKLLLDQNLSHRLISQLPAEFSASAHVRDVGLLDADDLAVWKFAAKNGFAVLSKDSDFQQRALLFGQPPKIVWLRVGNLGTDAIAALLKTRRFDILEFDADPAESILILS